MEKRRFTREAYAGTTAKVEAAGGDTSFAGRQEIKKTGKLHPLVDPAGFGLIRKSWPRYVELTNNQLMLANGIPMLVESLLDTTGSMRSNVGDAFRSLPQLYDLLTSGAVPVLGRYDPQIINSIFGDVVDDFILVRSQAEMDEKIAEQLTLMVPEGKGGDTAEDPEYGLFGAAFLTDAFINRYNFEDCYGLKGYHFLVTDAPSHGRIDKVNLIRVFSEEVFNKVSENGHIIDPQDLPDTQAIVNQLKKRMHSFVINVGNAFASYWADFYGAERVVVVDSTANLAIVQATLIGLTEGVLDLHSVSDYLEGVGCSKTVARSIQRAVAGIPIGAQCTLAHFDEIPEKGMVFAQKHDLWPIKASAPTAIDSPPTKWL